MIILTWVDNVKEAIDFIEAHLFEPISVDAVGRAINYAPSSFSNIFTAIAGYSVGEYIRFRRLSWAADELATGDRTVTDVAFDCGYETVEAFSKAFKRLFGYPPSKVSELRSGYQRFSPLFIDFKFTGGFTMKRNLIPDLMRVDWSDVQRQNEYVNSVVSALNGVGEKLDYDYVCAVSGSAFRTSFSKSGWNHGNYHVSNTPMIVDHTFRMLGYEVSHHRRRDYESDSRQIMASIDRGFPAITIEGVITNADACVISGYDNDGSVLLGYNPFMDMGDDHKDGLDETGYFRKADWHGGFFEGWKAAIVVIEGKREKPNRAAILAETLDMISRLIREETLVGDQHNGLAAHRAFANALLTYTWTDNFDVYLNVMCNYKQYLDRKYAVKFFRDFGRDDLAARYEEIAALCAKLGQIIPQDFSATDMFADKENLRPYCDVLLQICELEEKVLPLLQ